MILYLSTHFSFPFMHMYFTPKEWMGIYIAWNEDDWTDMIHMSFGSFCPQASTISFPGVL